MLVIRKNTPWYLFFYERILLKATEDKECILDCILGSEKRWSLEKGDEIILRVKKSKMIEVGDKLSFRFCVDRDHETGKDQIPCSWYYG